MYAEYRQKQRLSAASSNRTPPHHPQHDPAILHDLSTTERDAVGAAWEEAERQCRESSTGERGVGGGGGDGWRTVRVFVSSTFTDMHNEREVLVKKVFPRVREWCGMRRARLVECDLRWGVPRDSPTTATIAACMDEIRRCHHHTLGKPFFVAMLGERYGWIPQRKDIPDTTSYEWIDGLSVTNMEIQYGAYSCDNPNALFFLRDPAILEQIPQNKRPRFQDDSPVAKAHLKILKHKVQEKFPNQTFQYTVRYDGVDTSTGREQVKLSGYEYFEETVTSQLIAAIERTFPQTTDDADTPDEDNETALHDELLERLAANVVGREDEIRQLLLYGSGDHIELPVYIHDPLQAVDHYKLEADDARLLCVTSDSGMGKSSLLAATAKQAIRQGLSVMYHNIGGSPRSRSCFHLVKRILTALQHDPEKASSVSLLQDEMVAALQKARHSGHQLFIVLDGVDELDDVTELSHLFWLPVQLPARVRCVVSFKDGGAASGFKMAIAQAMHLQLVPLDKTQRENMVAEFFAGFNKKLDPSQLSCLLDHGGSSLPLWLHVACEELRVHGDFATLTARIQALPPDLPQLMEGIIERLVREDDTKLLRKFLCVLQHSPRGVPETELGWLLGDCGAQGIAQEPAPALHVATVRLALKPFLQTTTVMGVPRIHFFHPSFATAVARHMQAAGENEMQWKTYLADFYEFHARDRFFDHDDLPTHLLDAKLFKRLHDFYQLTQRGKFIPGRIKRQYIMALRCGRHAPANLPNTSVLSVCAQCLPAHCFLCGDRLMGAAQAPATLCPMHHRHPTDARNAACAKCGRVSPGGVTAAAVCAWCNQGVRSNTCCHLATQ